MKAKDLTQEQCVIIAYNRPDWMADNRPGWMADNRPNWMAYNRPDFTVPDEILVLLNI